MCHRVLRQPSAVDERGGRHLKGPVKGVAGQAPLLEPRKPVKSPTAPLNLQFNKVHAGDGTHMQYRKTHTGTLCRSQCTAQQSCCRIAWRLEKVGDCHLFCFLFLPPL